ncbi:MAG: hypothetical protein ACOCXI_08795 [Chloroflexota bacterium]
MAEQQVPEFPVEKRLEQARRNWNALFFGIVKYLREHGQSPEEFVQWLGERFAPGWEEMRGNLEEIAYYAALNPVSLGAELTRYDLGEQDATIQTTTEHLDASEEDIALIGQIYGPIMDYLDVEHEWEREGNVTTLRLRRRE